ncbi:MAG: radical SAM protein [candidate division Zixibacteria bacterium]|nr:radical SAM protein [candidate division Zixibacteria bacterium]
MEKKKLLLVYPKNFDSNYYDVQHIRVFGKKATFMNVALATVAALTPAEFDVRVIDENVEAIDFDVPYDLVGITGYNFDLPRAREVAKQFSKRGVMVVCGGPSVTLSTERWRPFADVLIIGEAERIWPQFLDDYLSGCHKQEYRERERFDLSISPIPDYSGFSERSRRAFFSGIVQTSRGCPYDCEFCSVHVYLGHKMRYKPTSQIIEELEQLYEMGFRGVFLADDNFAGNRKKAKEVLGALRDWNRQRRSSISFATQLSIETAKDEDFLKLATEAGLGTVVIGIETPNVDSLKETNKLHNLQSDMFEDIKKFHQHGIMVAAATIVGFDHDDLSIFQQQFDFFMRAGVPRVGVNPLQAHDGTRLKERMIKEGRYIDWDLDQSCSAEENLTYRNPFLERYQIVPKLMTPEQLKQGTYWLAWNLYKPENLLERIRAFLEDFENSPQRAQLDIPKVHLDWQRIGIVWRILKYFVTKASPKERRVFRQLLSLARKSSFSRRFQIVIGQFFMAKSIREVLLMQNPQIDQITYPEPNRDISSG